VEFSLSLKFAGRHAFKRNPQVLRWRKEMVEREGALPEQHRARQETLLARLFETAARTPAYERTAKRAPRRDQLGFLKDAFPVIDKSSLLRAGDAYLAGGGVPWQRFTVAATSGTTGTPLDVFRSLGSMLREEAFHLQHWGWAGWQHGDHQAVLRGDMVGPIERGKPPFWFWDSAGAQLVLSTRDLDEQRAVSFAEQIQRFGVTQLRAYPSAAYDLATCIAEAGLTLRLNSVITGSEMLYDFQRRRIESVFKTRVFDFYGLAERVAYASECQHGRMHVNPEYGVVEILDEHDQPTQDIGTIVGTSLHNHLMPLIRYRTLDTARWSPEPCPCGRTYPVIEKLSGRLADQLFDLDGRAVNCTIIGFAFDGMHNIDKAQVVQIAHDSWVIRMVPGPRYSEIDGQRVLQKLAQEVSPRVRARIELVREIPPLPSGKYQWVVQQWRTGPKPLAAVGATA
jgi:phenylacetate-coenzyme A ligase PaaK-like adenylate-forming protein